jgi:hypothetical protein
MKYMPILPPSHLSGLKIAFLYYTSGRLYGTERALLNLLSHFIAHGSDLICLMGIRSAPAITCINSQLVNSKFLIATHVHRLTSVFPSEFKPLRLVLDISSSLRMINAATSKWGPTSLVCMSPYLLPALLLSRMYNKSHPRHLVLWLHAPLSFFPLPLRILVRFGAAFSFYSVVVCSSKEVGCVTLNGLLERRPFNCTCILLNNFLSFNSSVSSSSLLEDLLL